MQLVLTVQKTDYISYTAVKSYKWLK